MSRHILPLEQRSWLLSQMETWRAQGIISEDQAGRILELYESPKDTAERHQNTALFVMMALAGTLIGLAVLLFVAFNWEAMPAVLKLALIFGVIAGTYAGGVYLRYGRQALRVSEVLFLLGCIFYGAGIALVAQIFHLNAHYPDGIWWWAVGVLPVALCLDTLLLHLLLVGLLALWTGMEIIGFPHLGGWFFVRWHWLPNGAYTLPLLALPGLVWAYRKNSPATAALYAPLLAWWLLLQPVAWRWDTNPIYLIGTVGGLFLIVAESHAPGSPFARVYRFWGMLVTAGVFLPLSFYSFTRHGFRQDELLAGMAQAGVILVMTGAVVALGMMLHRRDEAPGNPFIDRLRVFLGRQWLPIGVTLAMAVMASWQALWASFDAEAVSAVLPTVLANVSLVALALWLMRVGLREERGRPFAAGVALFLAWVVMRYIDLFGDVGGMLGASFLFFLCGAGLFGVALYWRNRKGA